MLVTAVAVMAGEELKVLTIGNSFADSVFRDLPKIAASTPDCKLKLDRANIGGCSLQRHWDEIGKADADPNYKPYAGKYTLKEKLESEKWDIVTLQQVSTMSFKPETFEPYLSDLIAYVRKYAPTAQIVLQMTWAYRDDHRLFDSGELTPDKMFDGIFKSYEIYGKKYNLLVIPSGKAVKLALDTQNPKFVKPDQRADLTGLKYPERPAAIPGTLHTDMNWGKNKEGVQTANYDLIHLNSRGSYLQSCVWFAVLFNKDPRQITYAPETLTPEDAAFLRDCAAKAVADYKQPKDQ